MREGIEWKLLPDDDLRRAFVGSIRELHPGCGGPRVLDDELAFSLGARVLLVLPCCVWVSG